VKRRMVGWALVIATVTLAACNNLPKPPIPHF
jgi:predicted small secreted protein